MKLISRLLIVAIVPMMLLVACTNQDSNAQGQAPAPLVPSDTEQAARQAQAAAEEMRQTINRLMQENQQLTRELHAMQARAMDQGSTLTNLSQQASRLEGAVAAAAAGAGGDAAAIAAIAQQQAAQRDADAKSPFGSLVLIIIFALVALIVIYFIYRALKPRPFEDDEDDDFSSFDDDFGFDDEEDDDESADEDKKQDDEDDK